MKTVRIRSNSISLPSEIVKRLGSKEIELIETGDGVLLRPTGNIIKSTRGFLKGKSSFSSNTFMERKKEEKGLE